MYCMEHTGTGFETLKPQFALCRALGVAPLVRVPATEYHFVARALDCGALGVMVPLVDTAEQAERIVSFTRYPPKGRRGAAFGFAHDDYRAGDVVEKMREIHGRTLVICMIETRAGLENVEAIAAVDGVDVLWLGHFDLTNFLGIPAQFSHPQYRDAVKRIAAAAARHGKSAGYMASSAELGREYLGHGYRMIATGTDQALLQNSLSQLIGSWKGN
jgi:2-dehydro-3-deoxyglucarate aldolase/4-hydroxy-2-oxoheptanedioate aldolase